MNNPFSQGISDVPYSPDDEEGKYKNSVNDVYFKNPPSSSPNPYTSGAGRYIPEEQSLAQSVRDGVNSLNDQRGQSPATDSPPTASEFYDDQGYGPSGTGRS